VVKSGRANVLLERVVIDRNRSSCHSRSQLSRPHHQPTSLSAGGRQLGCFRRGQRREKWRLDRAACMQSTRVAKTASVCIAIIQKGNHEESQSSAF
jgi:hypothetical protein